MQKLFRLELFQGSDGKYLMELDGVLEDSDQVMTKLCNNRGAAVKALREFVNSVELAFDVR